MVVTACAGRKRLPPAKGLCAADLPFGKLHEVAASWLTRLARTPRTMEASRLYVGRAFGEACRAASEGDLYVVSAGLGLLPAHVPVPAYSLTVSPESPDDVLARITEAVSAADWWRVGPARSGLGVDLSELVKATADRSLLLALPLTYLDMLAPALLALPVSVHGRLRLFCGVSATRLPVPLRPCLMPYDDRLNAAASPHRGTRADFAQRAVRHFVEHVLPHSPAGTANAHRAAVEAALAGLRPPPAIRRDRRDDDELRALIGAHWQAAEGQAGRMLRVLRDQLGVACEQKRFAELFRKIRAERAAAAAP